jgi:hypothetical protein
MSPLCWVLVALLVASAALFAVGAIAVTALAWAGHRRRAGRASPPRAHRAARTRWHDARAIAT